MPDASKISKAVVGRSIREGRIPASRRDHYERLYDAAPLETVDLLATLPAGSAPSAYASAAPAASHPTVTPSAPGGEDYPTNGLTPEEHERIARAQAGLPPVRIVTEPGGGS